MVGFQAKALLQSDEKLLAKIAIDEKEMEDIRGFSREFVQERLEGWSSALGYTPNETEKEFHIPG